MDEEWNHKWSDFKITVAPSRAPVLLNFGFEGLWQCFSQARVCVCLCVFNPKVIVTKDVTMLADK